MGAVRRLALFVIGLLLLASPQTAARAMDGKQDEKPRAETPNSEKGKDGQKEEKSAPEKEGEHPEKAEREDEKALPLLARFEDGVLFSSLDEQFQLRIHVLAQGDYKLFLPTVQQPARSGVYIPRFRTYFEGRVTRSFEYELSLQRSVEGTFDVLDANLNYRPCDEFQIKVGRFLVPYSYDWYDHLEQFFITPERGLFPLNFGLSRQAGILFWGNLFDGHLQYALGGFDGQLTGLADNNTTRDAVGYVNFRPFRARDEFPALRFLNLGGSVALGMQAYPQAPLPLRTSIQSSENDEAAQGASSTFLDFNDDVVARGGGRFSAALHLAWYYRHLSLEAEWQTGRFPYARLAVPGSVKVPVQGYHLTAGYFITGEEVERRTVVEPLNPFDPASGKCGTGAIEPFARYSQLDLGEEVFRAGLADPFRWSRSAYMTDIGWNWYPNRFVKFTFDWQHTAFATPVLLEEAKNRFADAVDLFWVRCQLWY